MLCRINYKTIKLFGLLNYVCHRPWVQRCDVILFRKIEDNVSISETIIIGIITNNYYYNTFFKLSLTVGNVSVFLVRNINN